MKDFDRLRRIADIIRTLRKDSAASNALSHRMVSQVMQSDEINAIYALAMGEDEKWVPS